MVPFFIYKLGTFLRSFFIFWLGPKAGTLLWSSFIFWLGLKRGLFYGLLLFFWAGPKEGTFLWSFFIFWLGPKANRLVGLIIIRPARHVHKPAIVNGLIHNKTSVTLSSFLILHSIISIIFNFANQTTSTIQSLLSHVTRSIFYSE